MTTSLSRRKILGGGLALGCSVAASPLLTPLVMVATPGDMRLVVLILRGGMDGLDAIRPVGDPSFAAMRSDLGTEAGALEMNGLFALHPALADMMPLWQAGEFGVVHATSTPYRGKRSHFDGQDLLEAGTLSVGSREADGGWLNRALGLVSGVEARSAFALGRDQIKVLEGPAPVSAWVPGADFSMSPQAESLAANLMQQDGRFHAAWDEALSLSGLKPTGPSGNGHIALARYAADRLLDETRIASFSLSGWDTHANQVTSLPRALSRLSDVIGIFHKYANPVWDRTLILGVTEFGRTARQNGTKGTDHGTGGAMIMAGGALKGGQVFGSWPKLEEADLYERRDLMPTTDLRAWCGHAVQGALGLSTSDIERTVFPGVEMATAHSLLL